ncbi:hypothetical protein [Roseibium sediminicola]|uniref:Uncharacterized protein n=1 Tax=Roseibium sediminicola TaxID=2933272 RepID=A0ABT0GM83_9HYPH|nr:hypothetical protein [Roseibium sp. CAU 1639]MCK7610537.1 hypothetical protein [Roseibium sp. CAU 1639]
MSFGFDRIGLPLRREKLENEPHFLRFRSWMKTNSLQTISASFMGQSLRMTLLGADAFEAEHSNLQIGELACRRNAPGVDALLSGTTALPPTASS